LLCLDIHILLITYKLLLTYYDNFQRYRQGQGKGLDLGGQGQNRRSQTKAIKIWPRGASRLISPVLE